MSHEGNSSEVANKPRKKRILFVVTQSEFGGAQQFISQLISHLPADKFETALVVGKDGGNEIKSLLPEHTAYIVAKHLIREPNLWSDVRSIFELRKIYREYKPDVVFLNSSKAGFNGSLAISGLFWRLPNIKVIYRIGGWQFNDPIPKWKRFLYIGLEKLSARFKDEIVVNNLSDFHDAQRLSIRPRNQVHLIHNGIDPYIKFPNRTEVHQKLLSELPNDTLLRSDVRIVGTIANFYETKGLSFLIQASAQLPADTITMIIGDGKLRSKLEQEIRNLGLEEKVFLIGRRSNATQYLPALDVFVLPSVKEGFPWVILEAITARVPVVATRVGAVPEIIESGKSGIIVSPGNPDELVRAIMEVTADKLLADEMTIQAHQNLIQKFNLRSMVEKYESLLDS